MQNANSFFTFSVEDKRWHVFVPSLIPFAQRVCKNFQRAIHADERPCSINVLFSNARKVKKLNKCFRGKNKSTNVLSFPASFGRGGDIILSIEDVRKEAIAQQKTFRTHTAHLLIHGCLHLENYTHDHPAKARLMENLETYLLHFSHIPNPWRKTKLRFFAGRKQ